MKLNRAFFVLAVGTCMSLPAFASNVVSCTDGLKVTPGQPFSSPGNNTPTTPITIQISNQDSLDYFAENGFPIRNGRIHADTTQYEQPYQYSFIDQAYGANAGWTIAANFGGMKVVASNPYTGKSVNWFFSGCTFQ